MAKTLAQINKQIEKLQNEAAAIKARESAGVIQRIRDAIAHYSLTEEDLFAPGVAKVVKRRGRKAALDKPGRAAAGKKTAAKKPTVGVIRYRDDAGNAWTGRGKRPRWFLAAVASGKSLDDLAANRPGLSAFDKAA